MGCLFLLSSRFVHYSQSQCPRREGPGQVTSAHSWSVNLGTIQEEYEEDEAKEWREEGKEGGHAVERDGQDKYKQSLFGEGCVQVRGSPLAPGDPLQSPWD